MPYAPKVEATENNNNNNLSILLQLLSEFILQFCLPCTMQQYQDFKIKFFFKFVTALHVWAYLAIITCVEIRGNCCAFRDTAICVFVFTVFLSKVNVAPTSMPRVLPFLARLFSVTRAV
jgi:hypothetical protein